MAQHGRAQNGGVKFLPVGFEYQLYHSLARRLSESPNHSDPAIPPLEIPMWPQVPGSMVCNSKRLEPT